MVEDVLMQGNPDSRTPTESPTSADLKQRALQSKAPVEVLDSEMRVQEAKLLDGAPGQPMAAAEPRPLKLVLTLTPAQTAGYRVLLALGSDGCDPVFRSAEVADLPAAFQEIATLVVSAETRWQIQPRNPAATKRGSGTAAKQVDTKQQPAQAQQPGPDRPASADAPAQSDQLPLFG
jgi:hypothetical protein